MNYLNTITRKTGLAGLVLLVAGAVACGSEEIKDKITSGLNTDDVDFEMVRAMAGYSEMAYETSGNIETAYADATGVYVGNTGTDTDVQYFVLKTGSGDKAEQVLAFRGTANSANVGVDLNYGLDADSTLGIDLHSGFRDTALLVLTDITDNQRIATDQPVSITGHSLGGALAALVALYLDEAGYQVKGVVTFGQPKTTTAAGVEAIGDFPLLRVINNDDGVALVPPAAPNGTSYRHFGDGLLILKNGAAFRFSDSGDPVNLLGEIESAWDGITSGTELSSLVHHSLSNSYIPHIDTLVETYE